MTYSPIRKQARCNGVLDSAVREGPALPSFKAAATTALPALTLTPALVADGRADCTDPDCYPTRQYHPEEAN
jgi:hypothetical protein